LSLDAIATLLSAVASLISVGIAGYLVIETKRESPNIVFVPVLWNAAKELQTQSSTQMTAKLLFQNIGARTGSLVRVDLTPPPPSDHGQIVTTILGLSVHYPEIVAYPVILQPYTSALIDVVIGLRGTPDVKTLISSLGDASRIEVKYIVSTKTDNKHRQGLEMRTAYMPVGL
jgi:hypothetical protein